MVPPGVGGNCRPWGGGGGWDMGGGEANFLVPELKASTAATPQWCSMYYGPGIPSTYSEKLENKENWGMGQNVSFLENSAEQ